MRYKINYVDGHDLKFRSFYVEAESQQEAIFKLYVERGDFDHVIDEIIEVKTKKYLAYGSNLNFEQMQIRCPHSKIYGTGILEGYRLAFRGSPLNAHATIIPSKGRTVPVLVWDVPEEDERRLDRYEGYPTYYFKKDLPVIIDKTGEKVTAMVYIMDVRRSPNYPSRFYIDTVAQGYEDCGFNILDLQAALSETILALNNVAELA